MTATARDFGIICGIMPTGSKNAITDVPGVRVGHHTLRDGDINTGVTAILPMMAISIGARCWPPAM